MDVAAPAPARHAQAPPVPARRSALAAAILGWVVPGFGQLYVGRPLKALLMFAAIGGLFYLGLVLTGFTCVDPHAYPLEFIAHALLGGPTAATYHLTQDIELTQRLPWYDVGRLYAAVAGLLNVVAICDALGEVVEHNRHVEERRGLRARFLAEREAEAERAMQEARRREASLQTAYDAPAAFPDAAGDDTSSGTDHAPDRPAGDPAPSEAGEESPGEEPRS